VKIRRAKASDAARCAEISCVRTAEELKKLLKQGDTQWLVIEDDNGVVVGLGIINFWAWNKMAWIYHQFLGLEQDGVDMGFVGG